MALFIEAAPGDRVKIGDSVVTVVEKSGKRTRLRIDTTADVDHQKAGTFPTRPPLGAQKASPVVLHRPALKRPA